VDGSFLRLLMAPPATHEPIGPHPTPSRTLPGNTRLIGGKDSLRVTLRTGLSQRGIVSNSPGLSGDWSHLRAFSEFDSFLPNQKKPPVGGLFGWGSDRETT
jgi:hypothetical protein